MRASIVTISALACALAACALDNEGAESAASSTAIETTRAVAILTDADGNRVGDARMIEREESLFIEASVANLPPGQSGFHLHTFGRCDAPDFKSAGGHLNPDMREHGALNPDGKHLGDLPNLAIGADGSGQINAKIASMSTGALAAIFDEDGTAVMIHADPDDYASDPTGNAGARIACGVVEKIED